MEIKTQPHIIHLFCYLAYQDSSKLLSFVTAQTHLPKNADYMCGIGTVESLLIPLVAFSPSSAFLSFNPSGRVSSDDVARNWSRSSVQHIPVKSDQVRRSALAKPT